MLDWGRGMLGNASLTETANLESFAHWPTQRFETMARGGPPVTICNGAPFRWFWPVFRHPADDYLTNRSFSQRSALRTVSEGL